MIVKRRYFFWIPGLLLATAAFSQQALPEANIVLKLVQTVPGNIFYTDEPKQIIVEGNADSITWAIADHRGEALKSGILLPKAERSVLAMDPGRNGWFRLDVRSWKNKQVVEKKETSFAVLERFDLASVDSSAFIGQTHHWQAIDTLIPIAARMGVKYVRDNIRWESVEKTKGEYSVSAKQEQHMNLLKKYNLLPFNILALYNPLYDGGNSPVSSESVNAFALYGKFLLNRFPQIKEIEIWNEPDIPTFSKGLSGDQQKADFYFNLLKETYTQLHRTFPQVRFSGFAMSELASEFLINSLLERGALNYLHSFSFHSYIPVPELIDAEIRRQKKLLGKYTQNLPPLILSETGYSTSNFTEKQQAEFLVRRVVAALSHGIGKVGIYNLQNKGVDGEKESEFGLIRHGLDLRGPYVPKPAYVAYASLIRQLTGYTFVRTEHSKDSLVYSYLFRKGKEDLRMIYAVSKTKLKFFCTSQLVVTDMMGVTAKVLPKLGSITLDLSGEPVFIRGILTGRLFEEVKLPALRPVTMDFGYYAGGYKEYPEIIDNPMLPDSVKKSRWFGAAGVKGIYAQASRVIERFDDRPYAVWTPAITIPGFYRFSVFIPGDSSNKIIRAGKAMYTVIQNGRRFDSIIVDQHQFQGQFVTLGTFYLETGRSSGVEIHVAGLPDGPLRADIVRVEMIPAKEVNTSADIFWMQPGETQLPAASVLPANATDKQIRWTSEDINVATVNSDGLIRAVREGEAFVRATNSATGLYSRIRIIVSD